MLVAIALLDEVVALCAGAKVGEYAAEYTVDDKADGYV